MLRVDMNHICFRLSIRHSQSFLNSLLWSLVSGRYYIRTRMREVQSAYRQSHGHVIVCREQSGAVCGLGRKGRGQPSRPEFQCVLSAPRSHVSMGRRRGERGRVLSALRRSEWR